MRIAVPLSPLDPVEIGGKSGKSGKSGEFDDSENVVPAQNSSLASRSVKSTAQDARIREVNASSPRSSTIHSFPCLERTPLSDIDNSAGFSTRSSPAKSQLEFRKREQHVSLSVTAPSPASQSQDKEQATPTLVTGPPPGSAMRTHRRQKIEALEREVADLKDFVVELNSSKRTMERLLEEEKEAHATLAREFALREGALQNRIMTLKGMLKMVSLEKERLISFGVMESAVKDA
jgi:hypothetical protein